MSATSISFASGVLGVAPYVVANKVKNIQEIKHYGKGKLISCCVLESAMSPYSIGCVRRCTVSLAGYEEKLLRETLTRVTEVSRNCDIALEAQAGGGGNRKSSSEHLVNKAAARRRVDDEPVVEVQGAHKTIVELAYLPCGDGESHRCVFSPAASASIVSSHTIITVSEVSNSVNRCYVEVENTTLFTPADAGADDEERLQRRRVVREVTGFWQRYVDALVYSLEAAVLYEAYPVLSSTEDLEFRQAYEAVEETFCQWSAATAAVLPKRDVLDTVEAALLSWSRVLREYRHTKLSAETAKDDVAGTRRVAAEAARQLADRTAAVEDLQQQLSHMQETDVRHKEFVAMSETVSAMRQSMESQQRARRMLVEKHKREYSSAPGVSNKVGGNETDSLFPPSVARANLTGSRTATGRPNSVPQNANAKATKAAPPAANPAPFNKMMLDKLFGPDGSLSDEQANEVFHALLRLPTESSGPASVASGLALRKGEYVTAEEMLAVLLSMDHVGLYEDVDGTQEQLSEWRAAVHDTFASRYGSAASAPAGRPRAPGNTAAGAQDETAPWDRLATSSTSAADRGERRPQGGATALNKMVARHEAQKGERRLQAMSKLADDTVARYAFREPGKLYFDEFCLALMHLLR